MLLHSDGSTVSRRHKTQVLNPRLNQIVQLNYKEWTQLKIDSNQPVILHITFIIGRIVFYLIKSLICLSVHLPIPIIDLVVKEMAPAPEITLARSNQNKNCTGKVQLQRLFNIESRYEHTSIFMHFCF